MTGASGERYGSCVWAGSCPTKHGEVLMVDGAGWDGVGAGEEGTLIISEAGKGSGMSNDIKSGTASEAVEESFELDV